MTDISATRFPVIAVDRLPPMEVIETIDSEKIITDRMTKLKSYWSASSPPAAAQYDVENLEFDPIRINQEASTYFETLLRDRVNQACRAVTLAFCTGGDADAIGSRYPGGCPRQAVVADPRDYEDHPEDWEDDDRYRRRVWLSPSILTPHGTCEAYEFWALSANSSLRDASAVTKQGTGAVYITVLQEGSDPKPTSQQLLDVYTYINNYARRGLTDYIYVQPPKITETKYKIRYWCFPGPDPTAVETAIKAALEKLVDNQRWIGCDHTLMAINGALSQNGVYNAIIDEPTKDLVVGTDGYVKVKSIELSYQGRGE